MRFLSGHLAALVAGTLAVCAAAQAPSSNPAAVLAAAREALGGESKLSSVKTFVATGRTRQVQGDNLVPIEFEIACELPNRCVRRDEIPARESGPTTIGFSGDDLIQLPVPPIPASVAGVAPPPGARPAGAPPPTGAPPSPPANAEPPAGPPRGADTVEETTFDRYRINARIDPRRFEARR